ncbi:unnamed protein product [Moneuplotes crassus]|uniref:RING-type domain-containing protein n=1 Tax=Euplotes crassus TaxID=5936 RepID=A0AAD1U989_EUPCR|nr:unnamed protein product [Moneuplotes crassus]
METRSSSAIKNLEFQPMEFSDDENCSLNELDVQPEVIDQALRDPNCIISQADREMPIRLHSDQEVPEYPPIPPILLGLPLDDAPIEEESEPEESVSEDDNESSKKKSKKSKKRAKKKAKKKAKKERKRKRKEKERKKKLEEAKMMDSAAVKQEREDYERTRNLFIKTFIKHKLNKAAQGAISKEAVKECLTKSSIKSLRNEIMCAVCQDIINDPVMLMTCAHRFCKECIETHIRVSKKSCPICITPIETRRIMRDDKKINGLCKKLVKLLKADFAFINEEDEQEKETYSKAIIKEQSLINEIKKRQINDQKNMHKKKTNRGKKKKTRAGEKTAEEKEAEKVVSEENYNRRPDNDITILQDDYQLKKYKLVPRMRIVVNGLCPILYLGKYVAYKNKFDIIIWPNIQFFMACGDKLRKVKHIDRIDQVKEKFGIKGNKLTIYYRKIVTKSYPKYMNMIQNTTQNMRPYNGVNKPPVANPDINIGNKDLFSTEAPTAQLVKKEDLAPKQDDPIEAMTNQERINQLNNVGSSSKLENCLGDLFK